MLLIDCENMQTYLLIDCYYVIFKLCYCNLLWKKCKHILIKTQLKTRFFQIHKNCELIKKLPLITLKKLLSML